MILFENLASWIPDSPSEDRISVTVLRVLESGGWNRVYYNPPSGSWKGLSIYRGGYEYRQVGPKRGIKEGLRRPDFAVQDMCTGKEVPVFLLFETKRSHSQWDEDYAVRMRAYFEDTEKGVKRVPFNHRRKVGSSKWESILGENKTRMWFSEAEALYLFGFAYGPIMPEDLEKEEQWMEDAVKQAALVRLGSIPPMVMIAVSFEPSSMKPRFAVAYSKTFPEDYRVRLKELFS